jgi:hypothetical protein
MTSSPVKKRVHFATSSPMVHTIVDHADHDASDAWLQTSDFERFRAAARLMVATAKKQEIFKSSITGIYRLAGRVASKVSSENSLSEALVSVPVGNHLTLWCCGFSFRGLEKHVRDQNFNLPLNYQREIVDMHRKVATAEDLRSVSQYLTRRDRILARMLGQGDATAAHGSVTSTKETGMIPWSRISERVKELKPRQLMPQQA